MKPALLLQASLALVLAAFTNCSDVNFANPDGAGGKAGTIVDNGDGSVGGDLNQPGFGSTGGSTNPGDASGGVVQPGSGSTGGTNTGGTNTGGTNTGGGSTGPAPIGTGNTSAAILPKVQFIGPPCIRLTMCEIEFRLDKAYADYTQFDWRTNDNAYTIPHNPPYGRASVEYVSTSGHVTFAPGETSKKVYVQNINQSNTEIAIGVIMSRCQYGNLYEGCSKFFPAQ